MHFQTANVIMLQGLFARCSYFYSPRGLFSLSLSLCFFFSQCNFVYSYLFVSRFASGSDVFLASGRDRLPRREITPSYLSLIAAEPFKHRCVYLCMFLLVSLHASIDVE